MGSDRSLARTPAAAAAAVVVVVVVVVVAAAASSRTRLAHAHSFRLRECEQGFDEYMNLVLDEGEEVSMKRKTRKALGRIMLKGDNITLIQEADV